MTAHTVMLAQLSPAQRLALFQQLIAAERTAAAGRRQRRTATQTRQPVITPATRPQRSQPSQRQVASTRDLEFKVYARTAMQWDAAASCCPGCGCRPNLNGHCRCS